MKTPLSICILWAAANIALAQTPPPSTDPSSASSPHQRETTRAGAPETPAQSNPESTAPSTEHQKQVTKETRTARAQSDKMMKDCITKRQSASPSMSKDDAKRSCADEMKKNKGQ